MLSPREQELLTAYVDGELSARERRLADRLLRHNAQARALLDQLQADSRELQALPALKVPTDLAESVLQRLGTPPRTLPFRPRLVATPVRFPLWRGLAAAAAVLFAVGIGSFLLNHSTRPTDPGDDTLAHHDTDPARNHETPTPRHDVPRDKVDPPRDPAPGLAAKEPSNPRPAPSLETDPRPEHIPGMVDPDNPDDRILTSGDKDRPGQFERVELALPTIHALHSLDQPGTGKKLLDQLASGQGFRIELTARDATRGFARVQKAFADHKIGLVVDPSTAIRLKKPYWRTDLAVFLENITPADLVDILRAVGSADRQAGDKKPSESRFDGSLIVKEFSGWDRRELHDLLSIDPVKVRPTPPPARGVDIHRPLPDQTADQVAAALAGKGPIRPGTTGRNLSSYVTSLSGPRGRSLDLKLFLESRQPARPGTVQVFLVLRNVAP